MLTPYWNPPIEVTLEEERVLKRLARVRKLFGFLRRHRHEIFDESFQDELVEMYRSTGAGIPAVAPALLAMATLLQGYMGISDAEAVELSVMDRRWQLVLDRLGEDKPAFARGTLQAFRERMIEHDMDKRLLDRTVEVARETGGFDSKKLPQMLRIAVDSSPFEGAGRVEDTINLLGHAARKIVAMLAQITQQPKFNLAEDASIPVLNATSVKAGLDTNWSDAAMSFEALNELLDQVDALQVWMEDEEHLKHACLAEDLQALEQVQKQDLEEDPAHRGYQKIRQGAAKERRISIEDKEMRHGRKSSSRSIAGYKRHLVRDLDTGLIPAVAITPANRPESEALDPLFKNLGTQSQAVGELHIDRAYLSSPLIDQLQAEGVELISRPWMARNRKGLYAKHDFEIDLETMEIRCPADHAAPIGSLGSVVEFPASACDSCALRAHCTERQAGRGRTVRIAEDEPLQQHLRRYVDTPEGREKLRQRVPVEHSLAHLGARQGPQARYIGARKNLYDIRRAAAIQNLETTQRSLGEGYYRAAA